MAEHCRNGIHCQTHACICRCDGCAPARSQWTLVTHASCDICGTLAKYKHEAGGLRCETCPRPVETEEDRSVRLRALERAEHDRRRYGGWMP
jgi:hypothetical protein